MTSNESNLSSDQQLWSSICRGDVESFRAIVQRYQSAVTGVAYALVGDFSASQDIAQEVFWVAWKDRAGLRESARVGAWLCGIARNLARQWLRQRSASPAVRLEATTDPPDGSVVDPVSATIAKEEAALVWDALHALPESYREPLVLFYRQDQSVAQVAQVLGVSEDAVKQRLTRGRDLLRQQISDLVGEILVRTRPGKSFTSKVVAGIAGGAIALQAGGAATAATAAGSSAAGLASALPVSAAWSAAAGGTLGAAGGVAGGLAGAWLGTRLPSELAPTSTERDFLRVRGRRMLWVSVGYTALLLAFTPLLLFPFGWIVYLSLVVASSILFGAYTVLVSARTARALQEIRRTVSPLDDPNPSKLRAGLAGRYRGRSYTSRWRLLGIPLVDIQFADPIPLGGEQGRGSSGSAWGWVALGDRAAGVLLAAGGRAVGLVALGGIAIGLVSVGGLALGGFAVGGGAVGYLALGGVGLGWDALGGLAIGWHSAAGGAAVAYHCAMGGAAIARDFAVGGAALAESSNTEQARAVVAAGSYQSWLDWYIQHRLLCLVVTVVVAVLPVGLLRLVYRRVEPHP
jgi:RNA polymerase sigma factor (sigma-70 family)